MLKSKTLKEIKAEIEEIYNVSPEVFDKMSYLEIKRLHRKCKLIDSLYTDVHNFVENKKNPKTLKKPLDKSVKM